MLKKKDENEGETVSGLTHRRWRERKIRAAKRAARSELSVSKGEWCLPTSDADSTACMRPYTGWPRHASRFGCAAWLGQGTSCISRPMRPRIIVRTKHGYAQSDILSTAGIVDPVERIRCKVRHDSPIVTPTKVIRVRVN